MIFINQAETVIRFEKALWKIFVSDPDNGAAGILKLDRVFMLSILQNRSKLRNRPYINLPAASYISFRTRWFFFIPAFILLIFNLWIFREHFLVRELRRHGHDNSEAENSDIAINQKGPVAIYNASLCVQTYL